MQWGVQLLFLYSVSYSILSAGEVHIGVVGDQRWQTHLPISRLGVVTVVVVLQGLVEFVDLTERQLVVGQEHVSHKKTFKKNKKNTTKKKETGRTQLNASLLNEKNTDNSGLPIRL